MNKEKRKDILNLAGSKLKNVFGSKLRDVSIDDSFLDGYFFIKVTVSTPEIQDENGSKYRITVKHLFDDYTNDEWSMNRNIEDFVKDSISSVKDELFKLIFHPEK